MQPGRRAQIHRWLRERGKTQNWLAAEVGITPSYLSLILAGRREPSLRVAVRLEQVTGVSASEFCTTRSGPPKPERPGPSVAIGCSLDGIDPPWIWSWGGGFVPFHLMQITPTRADLMDKPHDWLFDSGRRFDFAGRLRELGGD